MTPSQISLRPATSDDRGLQYRAYAASHVHEFALAGWDEAQFDAFLSMQFSIRERAYALQFPTAEYSIIMFDGEPAGQIIVDRSEKAISLTDIALLPEFQGKGIGSRLISDLQAEACDSGRMMILSVERSNTAAKRLYDRLGFVVVGESEFNLEMEWKPA